MFDILDGEDPDISLLPWGSKEWQRDEQESDWQGRIRWLDIVDKEELKEDPECAEGAGESPTFFSNEEL
jgi:hypothetical protein